MGPNTSSSRVWKKIQTFGMIVSLLNALNPLMATAQITINDLPTCAVACAKSAASSVNCKLNDTACLCSQSGFTSSTIQCADTNGQCPIEDRASVDGVLAAMCLVSSSSSSSSSSSQTVTTTSKGLGPGPIKPLPSSTTSNNPPPPSPTSSSPSPSQSVPPITSPSTPSTSSSSALTSASSMFLPTTASETTDTGSQSASSTTVVVQTVTVPPTSLASSAAHRDTGSIRKFGMIAMLCAGMGLGVGL